MSNPWALLATRRGAAALLGLLTLGGGGTYLDSERRQAERASVALEESLLDWSRKAGELEGDLIVTRAREGWLDREGDRLQGQLDQTVAHLAASQRAASELRSRAARSSAAAAQLSRDLSALRRDRDLLEEELLQRREALGEAQAALAKTRARRRVLEGQLERARALVADQGRELRTQARDLALERARVEALETSLAEEQRRLAEARAQLRRGEREQRATRGERDRLRGELAREREAHRATRAKLAAAADEATRAEARLKAEAKRAALAEDTLAKLEAAGVNVERLSGARPLPALRAVILRVDPEAVPPRVVIDAGSSQGLMPGDVLHVVRDGRSVGRVEVDEVQARLSTARLVEGTRGLVLRPGDTIRSNVPKP